MRDRVDFLPTTAADMKSRGWSEVDFVYVTGDAYVDHPSFGTAIISRVLEKEGYISPEDTELYHIVDSAEEGMEYLKNCLRFGVSGTVKYDI